MFIIMLSFLSFFVSVRWLAAVHLSLTVLVYPCLFFFCPFISTAALAPPLTCPFSSPSPCLSLPHPSLPSLSLQCSTVIIIPLTE